MTPEQTVEAMSEGEVRVRLSVLLKQQSTTMNVLRAPVLNAQETFQSEEPDADKVEFLKGVIGAAIVQVNHSIAEAVMTERALLDEGRAIN